MNDLLKRNVTTLLLLEPIELSFGILDYYGLEEAFIADIDRPDLENCVICLFNVNKIDSLQSYLEETLAENKSYLEDYDYDGYIAVAFKFPEKYMEDYNIIKEGRYSEVSPEFRKLYGEKITFIDSNTSKVFKGRSIAYRIINRNKYLVRDLEQFLGVELSQYQEAWKDFNMDKEVLNISKYEQRPISSTESVTESQE